MNLYWYEEVAKLIRAKKVRLPYALTQSVLKLAGQRTKRGFVGASVFILFSSELSSIIFFNNRPTFIMFTSFAIVFAVIGVALFLHLRSDMEHHTRIIKMGDLLGHHLKDLAQFSLGDQEIRAAYILNVLAMEKRKLEIKYVSSDHPERIRTDKEWKEAYAILLQVGLISDDGYGKYFTKAQQQINEDEREATERAQMK